VDDLAHPVLAYPPVNATLYIAAMIHFSLGLWALYQRRYFRCTAAEITQLVLGRT
jgi:adenylate cyclase